MKIHLIQTGTYTDEIVINHFPYVLGRSSACDYQVFHPMVSRQHAELKVDQGRVAILDLASSNGTFVNGMRVSTPAVLRDGDEINLGSVAYRVALTPSKN